jgi:hypothetical protein
MVLSESSTQAYSPCRPVETGGGGEDLVDKHSSDVRDPIQVVLHPLEAMRLPVLAHALKTHHVERRFLSASRKNRIFGCLCRL